MALGQQPSQQSRSQVSEPNYYARLRLLGEDGLTLGFSYWKGALKISLSSRKDQSYQTEELTYIHLSPIKAHILAEYVQQIIDYPKSAPLGVNTGASDTQGLAVIHREPDGRPYLIIAKVDKDGKFVNNFKFRFMMNYNYGLKFDNVEKLAYQKEYKNDADLILFKNILEDYSRSANGAYGAATCDIARYEITKLTNNINQVMDKLGVERTYRSSNNRGNAGDSYFNNQSSSDGGYMNRPTGGNTRYQSGSIDELDEEFS